jgi:hypothetical protein
MLRVYCSLEDVKRLLRSLSNKESKIRFSEAYRSLQPDPNNTGDIALSGVNFVDTFAEHETYNFTYTDSTSFSVVGDVVGNVGSGNRFDTFTATDKFSVPSTNWSGSAVAGDIYYITAASDVSNEDGHQFLVDSTRRIDARLERIYGGLNNVSFYDSTSEEVPEAINFACSRYTAYDIFNSVFAGISDSEISPVVRWKKSAESTLENYLSGHGTGPKWKSRSLEVTVLGVPGRGDGVMDLSELSDSQNKIYNR